MGNLNIQYFVIAILLVFVVILIINIRQRKKEISKKNKIIETITSIINTSGFKIKVKDYKGYLESHQTLFEAIIIFKIYESIRHIKDNDFVKKSFINFVKNTGHSDTLYGSYDFIRVLFRNDVKDEDLHQLMYETLVHDANLYSGNKAMPYFYKLIGEEKFKLINEKFRYLNGLNNNDKKTGEKVKEELNMFKNFITFKE